MSDRPDVKDVVQPKEREKAESTVEELLADGQNLIRSHLFYCFGHGMLGVCPAKSEGMGDGIKLMRVV